MAGYSTRTLREKLGIKEHAHAAFIGAPGSVIGEIERDFETPLDFDSKLVRKSYNYIHFFTKSRLELTRTFPSLKKHLDENGMLRISWPKKAAKIETDLDENIVREIGLEIGLVDVKVCAIDEIWSGLKFVIRMKDRNTKPL